MDSVTNAVAPLHSRIERLSTLIEQIQVDSAAKNTVASRVVPEDELIAKYVNAFKGQSFTAKHNPDSVVIAPIVALKSAPSPPPQAASAAAAVTTTTATTTQKALNNELTKTKSSSSIYKPAQIPLKNRENETVASSRGSSASSFNAGANNPISVKANQSEDETEEGEDGSAEPKTTSSRHSIVPVKVSSARKKNNSNHSLVGNAAALARSGSQASSVHKKPPLVKQESSESISTKKSAELMYQNLADLATKTNLEGSVVKLPVTPTKDEDPDSPREF